MLRSIKSGQRKMRIIALKIEGEAPNFVIDDTLDARQVTIEGNVITPKVPFAQQPVVLGVGVAGSNGTINVTGPGDILIVGSDTAEKY